VVEILKDKGFLADLDYDLISKLTTPTAVAVVVALAVPEYQHQKTHMMELLLTAAQVQPQIL
jgi:hypothetical protein